MILRQAVSKNFVARKDEFETVISKVLHSGQYILGSEVEKFESEFAEYMQANRAFGVGSGFDALYIALKASGVDIGDEVIVPSFTAYPTVGAVIQTGATPIFADINLDTFLLDIESISDNVGPKTKAVIPVHLFGNVFDMGSIRFLEEKGIRIIEDCAQAHGARMNGVNVGNQGSFGCFSFYPSKNLGAFGDGGALTIRDERDAVFVKKYRTFGYNVDSRVAEMEGGINSRLDELQAAILRVKLKYLEADNTVRRKIAQTYEHSIESSAVKFQKSSDNALSAYHIFNIRLPNKKTRDELRTYLKTEGVQTNVYYETPQHLQRIFQSKKNRKLSNTITLANSILALPIYPELLQDDQKVVIDAINFFLGHKA